MATEKDRRVLLALSMIFKVRGGIPRFNQMLCLALDELAPSLNMQVKVLSLHDSLKDYRASGSPWKHIQFVPCGGKVRLAARMLIECLRGGVEIVLIGLLGMTPLGILTRPFTRRGFGFIVHGTEAWGSIPMTRRLAARQARYIFSVSRFTAESFVRAAKVDPARVLLLHNTLAPGFDRVPDRHETQDEGSELLTVARLWAEQKGKGVDHALRAFARIADRYPSLRYRIVGKGSDQPRLVALAASLGLRGRVIFEEDLTDAQLAERYSRCSVFVLPSGQEGFGIVFLEAMRFGRPCIGGRPGGTPEVVEDGRTGLIVPFGDEVALEAALDRLLSDEPLRRSMGEAGRRRLEERFIFARFAERVEQYMKVWLSGS